MGHAWERIKMHMCFHWENLKQTLGEPSQGWKNNNELNGAESFLRR